MPLSLSTVANNAVRATFTYKDETLNVEYRPNKITRKTFASMDAADKSGDILTQLDAMSELLAGKPDAPGTGVLLSWDLTDEQGVLVPLDAQRFEELPPAFLIWLFQCISQDVNNHPEALAPQMALPMTNPNENGKLLH